MGLMGLMGLMGHMGLCFAWIRPIFQKIPPRDLQSWKYALS